MIQFVIIHLYTRTPVTFTNDAFLCCKIHIHLLYIGWKWHTCLIDSTDGRKLICFLGVFNLKQTVIMLVIK